MPRKTYTPEYRSHLVSLVKAGRTPESLAREFEPSAPTIRSWVEATSLAEAGGQVVDKDARIRELERKVRGLEEEREILKKSGGLVRSGERVDPQEGFPFVKANQAEYSVARMCRVLRLSRSGFYAWMARVPSERKRRDQLLEAAIREEHIASRGIYGEPRIRAMLRRRGFTVGKVRVARIMQDAGIIGVTRRSKHWTTIRDARERPAPDLVDRRFEADGPNKLWVADITHVPARTGNFYLATVLDVWSRKIVGWATGSTMPAELAIAALDMALARRRPKKVVHHSDQGSQYTSLAFTKRCQAHDVQRSMGSVGDCYDNAMAESFFATVEAELLSLCGTFSSYEEADAQIFTFLEGFYNTRRLHSSLGMRSPVEFERDAAAESTVIPSNPQVASLPPGPPSSHPEELVQGRVAQATTT